MTFASPHKNQRTDIECLRGLSICFVILFHGFPKIFSGGFMGVDIFFVISGFLISGIIFNEISNNSFSFKNFYCRRIKRLYPALISFLILAIILGWFFMNLYEYSYIAKHIFTTLLLINNITLANEAGYFDVDSFLKPLLNLWSLSIEFQFYIFWPFLIYLLSAKKKYILFLILTIIICSFSYNIYLSSHDKIAGFYYSGSRLWELACGGLVAWLTFYNSESRLFNYKLKSFLSVAAILILIICFFLFNENSSSQPILLLLIIIASMILVGFKDSLAHKFFLSNSFLKFFGLISYPLYLFHWLFFSYVRSFLGVNLDYKLSCLIIVISIIISFITYQYIEKPIRKKNLNNFKIFYLILPFIFVGLLGLYIKNNNGIENRKINKLNTLGNWRNFYENLNNQHSYKCKQSYKINKKLYCIANSDQAKNLFMGDSHALAFSLSIYTQNKNFSSLTYFNHGCMPFEDYETYFGDHDKNCNLYKKEILEVIKNTPSIKNVILITRTAYCLNDQNRCLVSSSTGSKDKLEIFEDGYTKLISFILKQNKKVIFIIDTPELPMNISNNSKLNVLMPNKFYRYEIAYLEKFFAKYRRLIHNIKNKFPEVIFYDPINFFCEDNFCNVLSKDKQSPLYWDQDHISPKISGQIIEDMYKKGLIEQ